MQEIVKDLRNLASDIRQSSAPIQPAVSRIAGLVNVWAFTAVMFVLCIFAMLWERHMHFSKTQKLIDIVNEQAAERESLNLTQQRDTMHQVDLLYSALKSDGFDFQSVSQQIKERQQANEKCRSN